MSTMIKMVRSLAAVAALATAAPALAAGDAPHIEREQWSFSGPFGFFDRGQVQRGFKVYREVCASCHGLRQVAFRNLADDGGPSFTEEQAKQIASEYTVVDGPNVDGDMYERPGILADKFPSPFPNEEAARASNGGAYPPDFSLLAKARAGHRGFPWFVFSTRSPSIRISGADTLRSLDQLSEENPLSSARAYNPKFLGGR
ncbi:UNVERIFIED_CONTAM: hypothetical protein GTU68_016308 [Idotea baltica]|nr:hypothetical protein [Idotea baltica]